MRRTNPHIARAHYNTPLCATHSIHLQLTCRRPTSRHFPSNARTRHAARTATHEHPQRLHSSPYHTNYPDDNICTATTDAHPHLLPMPHCNHCPHEPRRVSSNQRLTSKSVRGRCLETHHVLVSQTVACGQSSSQAHLPSQCTLVVAQFDNDTQKRVSRPTDC